MFRLLLEKWTVLKEMLYVLRIPYKATISLQRRSLTLSDTFGIWLNMELHLNACIKNKNYKTELAKCLLKAVGNRKQVIFNNPLMTAAIFLDPRYRNQTINDQEKVQQAKETLLKIYRRMFVLSGKDKSQNNSNTSCFSDLSFEYDDRAELNKFLMDSRNDPSNVIQLNENPSFPIGSEEDIEYLLNTFAPELMSSEKSVLQFWEEAKQEHNRLYDLAMVVYSVPPTEVQMERDFSKLGFVFGDRRCRLTEERLEDIMNIHLNDEVFYEVRDEEITELYATTKP